MTDDVADVLKVEHHHGWAELVINRPDRRNSIIAPVSIAMTQALGDLEGNKDIASIIIRGQDGYFCSGIDLKALQADPPPPWRDQQGATWRELHLTLFRYPKPVIGAFERYGINAGAALGLACDILIAGETSFMQIGEIQQGTSAPMNLGWLKIKSNESAMARILLYGDRIPGPELVGMGLATESVPDGKVLERSREVAARFASFPAGATEVTKRAMIARRNIDDPEAFFQASSGASLLNANMVND